MVQYLRKYDDSETVEQILLTFRSADRPAPKRSLSASLYSTIKANTSNALNDSCLPISEKAEGKGRTMLSSDTDPVIFKFSMSLKSIVCQVNFTILP